MGEDRQLEQQRSSSSMKLDQFRLDRGLRRPGAKINGNPIKSVYVYSRPEWTRW